MLICKVLIAAAQLSVSFATHFALRRTKMTEELADKIQSIEEVMVIINGQIAALTGLTTHLLCLSTMRVALDRGDANFDRVARDMEEIATEQTTSVLRGDGPAIAAVAKRFQKEIFQTVTSQLKKEARILKVAALKGSRDN